MEDVKGYDRYRNEKYMVHDRFGDESVLVEGLHRAVELYRQLDDWAMAHVVPAPYIRRHIPEYFSIKHYLNGCGRDKDQLLLQIPLQDKSHSRLTKDRPRKTFAMNIAGPLRRHHFETLKKRALGFFENDAIMTQFIMAIETDYQEEEISLPRFIVRASKHLRAMAYKLDEDTGQWVKTYISVRRETDELEDELHLLLKKIDRCVKEGTYVFKVPSLFKGGHVKVMLDKRTEI